MFKEYDAFIHKQLREEGGKNWEIILEKHKRYIMFIQHERLIHLLVTVFVGTIMSFGSFITIVTQKTELLLFCIPLLILFIAYLLHYRFLENTTQSWYRIEDTLRSRF